MLDRQSLPFTLILKTGLRICLDLIELISLMCLLNKIPENFFFSLVNQYMEFEVFTGSVRKKSQNCLLGRISILEEKCFWTYGKFWQKILQTWMFIAPLFLMLEKNVDHPSLQRFSPDGRMVLKKILLWYNVTLVLLFISIQINYRYAMKICKLLHFCLVKVGFSFLSVIFIFKI